MFSIRTRGLKGQDLDLRLGRLALCVADHGRGKTTAADAIRLAVLGWVPSLGETVAKCAALFRGPLTEVEIAVDDLRRFSRRYKRKGDGGYESTVTADWVETAKGKQQPAAEILRLFGRDAAQVAQVLDVRALIDATPNQRAAALEQLLSASGWTVGETAAAIAEGLVRRLAEVEEDDAPADYRTMLPLLQERAGLMAVLETLNPSIWSRLTESGIAGLTAWSNERKKEHTQKAKDQAAARRELEKRLAGTSEAAAEEIARLESERGRLEREFGAARQRVTDAQRQQQAIKDAAMALTTAARTFEAAQTEHGAAVEAMAGRADHVARLAEIETALDELHPPKVWSNTEADELTQRALDADAVARSIEVLELHPERVEILERQWIELTEAIRVASESDWNEVLGLASQLDGDAVGQSARIERLKAVIARLQALATKNLPNIERLRDNTDAVELQLAEAREALKAEGLTRAARIHTRTEQEAEAQRLRKAASEMTATARAAYTRDLEAYESHKAGLTEEQATHKVAVETATGRLQAAETALDRAQTAHHAAEQRVADLGEAPEAVADERLALQDALDKVTKELTDHAATKATRDQLTKIITELAEAEILRDVFTALEAAAIDVRGKQTTEAGGPLREHMLAFLRAAGRTESPFFHAAAGVCDIGWITPAGDEVLVQVLSGAEWTLYTAALTSAILALRDAPVKVLLVDASRCNDAATIGLLRAIGSVAEGLTLCLVEHYRLPEAVPEAWQVVTLDAERKVAAA